MTGGDGPTGRPDACYGSRADTRTHPSGGRPSRKAQAPPARRAHAASSSAQAALHLIQRAFPPAALSAAPPPGSPLLHHHGEDGCDSYDTHDTPGAPRGTPGPGGSPLDLGGSSLFPRSGSGSSSSSSLSSSSSNRPNATPPAAPRHSTQHAMRHGIPGMPCRGGSDPPGRMTDSQLNTFHRLSHLWEKLQGGGKTGAEEMLDLIERDILMAEHARDPALRRRLRHLAEHAGEMHFAEVLEGACRHELPHLFGDDPNAFFEEVARETARRQRESERRIACAKLEWKEHLRGVDESLAAYFAEASSPCRTAAPIPSPGDWGCAAAHPRQAVGDAEPLTVTPVAANLYEKTVRQTPIMHPSVSGDLLRAMLSGQTEGYQTSIQLRGFGPADGEYRESLWSYRRISGGAVLSPVSPEGRRLWGVYPSADAAEGDCVLRPAGGGALLNTGMPAHLIRAWEQGGVPCLVGAEGSLVAPRVHSHVACGGIFPEAIVGMPSQHLVHLRRPREASGGVTAPNDMLDPLLLCPAERVFSSAGPGHGVSILADVAAESTWGCHGFEKGGRILSVSYEAEAVIGSRGPQGEVAEDVMLTDVEDIMWFFTMWVGGKLPGLLRTAPADRSQLFVGRGHSVLDLGRGVCVEYQSPWVWSPAPTEGMPQQLDISSNGMCALKAMHRTEGPDRATPDFQKTAAVALSLAAVSGESYRIRLSGALAGSKVGFANRTSTVQFWYHVSGCLELVGCTLVGLPEGVPHATRPLSDGDVVTFRHGVAGRITVAVNAEVVLDEGFCVNLKCPCGLKQTNTGNTPTPPCDLSGQHLGTLLHEDHTRIGSLVDAALLHSASELRAATYLLEKGASATLCRGEPNLDTLRWATFRGRTRYALGDGGRRVSLVGRCLGKSVVMTPPLRGPGPHRVSVVVRGVRNCELTSLVLMPPIGRMEDFAFLEVPGGISVACNGAANTLSGFRISRPLAARENLNPPVSRFDLYLDSASGHLDITLNGATAVTTAVPAFNSVLPGGAVPLCVGIITSEDIPDFSAELVDPLPVGIPLQVLGAGIPHRHQGEEGVTACRHHADLPAAAAAAAAATADAVRSSCAAEGEGLRPSPCDGEYHRWLPTYVRKGDAAFSLSYWGGRWQVASADGRLHGTSAPADPTLLQGAPDAASHMLAPPDPPGATPQQPANPFAAGASRLPRLQGPLQAAEPPAGWCAVAGGGSVAPDALVLLTPWPREGGVRGGDPAQRHALRLRLAASGAVNGAPCYEEEEGEVEGGSRLVVFWDAVARRWVVCPRRCCAAGWRCGGEGALYTSHEPAASPHLCSAWLRGAGGPAVRGWRHAPEVRITPAPPAATPTTTTPAATPPSVDTSIQHVVARGPLCQGAAMAAATAAASMRRSAASEGHPYSLAPIVPFSITSHPQPRAGAGCGAAPAAGSPWRVRGVTLFDHPPGTGKSHAIDRGLLCGRWGRPLPCAAQPGAAPVEALRIDLDAFSFPQGGPRCGAAAPQLMRRVQRGIRTHDRPGGGAIVIHVSHCTPEAHFHAFLASLLEGSCWGVGEGGDDGGAATTSTSTALQGEWDIIVELQRRSPATPGIVKGKGVAVTPGKLLPFDTSVVPESSRLLDTMRRLDGLEPLTGATIVGLMALGLDALPEDLSTEDSARFDRRLAGIPPRCLARVLRYATANRVLGEDINAGRYKGCDILSAQVLIYACARVSGCRDQLSDLQRCGGDEACIVEEGGRLPFLAPLDVHVYPVHESGWLSSTPGTRGLIRGRLPPRLRQAFEQYDAQRLKMATALRSHNGLVQSLPALTDYASEMSLCDVVSIASTVLNIPYGVTSAVLGDVGFAHTPLTAQHALQYLELLSTEQGTVVSGPPGSGKTFSLQLVRRLVACPVKCNIRRNFRGFGDMCSAMCTHLRVNNVLGSCFGKSADVGGLLWAAEFKRQVQNQCDGVEHLGRIASMAGLRHVRTTILQGISHTVSFSTDPPPRQGSCALPLWDAVVRLSHEESCCTTVDNLSTALTGLLSLAPRDIGVLSGASVQASRALRSTAMREIVGPDEHDTILRMLNRNFRFEALSRWMTHALPEMRCSEKTVDRLVRSRLQADLRRSPVKVPPSLAAALEGEPSARRAEDIAIPLAASLTHAACLPVQNTTLHLHLPEGCAPEALLALCRPMLMEALSCPGARYSVVVDGLRSGACPLSGVLKRIAIDRRWWLWEEELPETCGALPANLSFTLVVTEDAGEGGWGARGRSTLPDSLVQVTSRWSHLGGAAGCAQRFFEAALRSPCAGLTGNGFTPAHLQALAALGTSAHRYWVSAGLNPGKGHIHRTSTLFAAALRVCWGITTHTPHDPAASDYESCRHRGQTGDIGTPLSVPLRGSPTLRRIAGSRAGGGAGGVGGCVGTADTSDPALASMLLAVWVAYAAPLAGGQRAGLCSAVTACLSQGIPQLLDAAGAPPTHPYRLAPVGCLLSGTASDAAGCFLEASGLCGSDTLAGAVLASAMSAEAGSSCALVCASGAGREEAVLACKGVAGMLQGGGRCVHAAQDCREAVALVEGVRRAACAGAAEAAGVGDPRLGDQQGERVSGNPDRHIVVVSPQSTAEVESSALIRRVGERTSYTGGDLADESLLPSALCLLQVQATAGEASGATPLPDDLLNRCCVIRVDGV